MLTDDTPALELGKLLRDYRGRDVTVLDLRNTGSWTDFFVIATVTSGVHLQGLERHVKAFSREKGIDILRVSSRPRGMSPVSGEEWLIVDLGTVVVHLMSEKTRAFYELERLWSAGAVIFQEDPGAAPPF
ncbi:MAG: ribosome silencing factor [Spirochaetaceae bacterium]|jgi:ribosome-associated protein|nr:ribosome silencing factor [Spirochaetaceae bacterium]